MTEEIKQILKELNLSEKEIEVYMSLLMSGTQGATSIAKKSRLNRITTYHIIKSLTEKGLVSHVIKNGIKYFNASDPKVILNNLKEKEEKFEKVLPELEKLKESIMEHPNVEVYEGKEGIKSIMNDWVNNGKEIIAIGFGDIEKVMGIYFPIYTKRRIKAKINIRIMIRKTPYSIEKKKNDNKELREIRFIDCKQLSTGIYVYGDKVAFLTFDKAEPRGLLINDKHIVLTIRTLLELLWINSSK